MTISDASFECSNKGFHMTFNNNWMISVQIGPMNYCDNKVSLSSNSYDSETYSGPQECKNAEIAVISPNGDYVIEQGGVAGWTNPEITASLIEFVACLDSTDCIKSVGNDCNNIIAEHSFADGIKDFPI